MPRSWISPFPSGLFYHPCAGFVFHSLTIFQLLRDLLRLREEPKLTLHALLGKWLPIAPAVLTMAARCLPSPVKVTS